MADPCEGRTTHHAGCACHEARRDAEVSALRARVAELEAALARADHAANSWAKHVLEFGRISREAELVVVARCADFGMPATTAVLLIRERLAARAEKAAA